MYQLYQWGLFSTGKLGNFMYQKCKYWPVVSALTWFQFGSNHSQPDKKKTEQTEN